jgi:RNA polymerase sigma-70 factor (ECF subfamily)
VKPTTPAEAGDDQLAARVASGDASALEAVIEQYGQRVIGLAARLLGWTDGAEDVAQDVFVQVLHKGKQFRGQASLWTWLATLTVNRCRSIRRRRWLHDRVLGIVGRQAVPEAACPITKQQERSETATRVRAQVAQLPAAAREVIVLRYFEELPLDEIATVLGIKRNAVEARLSRARKQLEPLLRQENDFN